MDATKLINSSRDVPLAFVVDRKAVLRLRQTAAEKPALAALPRDILSRLLPHLKPVSLPRSKVLCDADEPLASVYFVETGLVSVVAVFNRCAAAEMATVGREGFAGIGILLGGEHALGRYMVPVPGFALAWRLRGFAARYARARSSARRVRPYAQAFLREALRTAACNSVHMVEQRCARRLLMNHDRSDGDTLTLTLEYLATTLGVCRSTVSLAAGALQRAGFIRYRRGAITVHDRAGLETASCECYRVIRSQYERLLPQTYEQTLIAR